MLLYHIAKILEIIGFLLATIFAGILLNREIVGRFADRVMHTLDNFVITFTEKVTPLFKFGVFLTSNEITKSILGATMLRGIAMTCIITGWVISISWVFWVGVAIAAPYVLIAFPFVFIRLKRLLRSKKIWLYSLLYPMLFCWSLLLSFIFAPIVVFIYLLVLYSLLIMVFLVNIIVAKDALKKGLIIFGSALIIIGLILETIVIW